MNVDLEALKAAALAAGGQPWTVDGYIVCEELGTDSEAIGRVNVAHMLSSEAAAHIAAANPAAVLALIERLERAEAEAAMLRANAVTSFQAGPGDVVVVRMPGGLEEGSEVAKVIRHRTGALVLVVADDVSVEKIEAFALEALQAELRRIHVEQAEAVGFHLGASGPEPDCWKCHKALVDAGTLPAPRMILCPTCGNKRCPKASDHDLACTGSNEPGQPGSVY